MASFASSATKCGAQKHVWTKNYDVFLLRLQLPAPTLVPGVSFLLFLSILSMHCFSTALEVPMKQIFSIPSYFVPTRRICKEHFCYTAVTYGIWVLWCHLQTNVYGHGCLEHPSAWSISYIFVLSHICLWSLAVKSRKKHLKISLKKKKNILRTRRIMS